MKRAFSSVFSGVAAAWCQAMHPDPMWPINGQYRCPKCLRQFPVRWANGMAVRERRHASETRAA